MKNFFVSVTRHPLSLLGTAVTSAAAFVFVTMFALEAIGFRGGPYTGILTFLVIPAVFLAGLAMIPAGVLLGRRRIRRAGRDDVGAFPVIDLNKGRTRGLVVTVVLLTLANTMIIALSTYKGVEVMESNEFCGTTCHNVMQPEWTTYLRSPHSRVACVDCHIGPGADWFVKSKLSGSWQVVSTAFDLYPRPIPTPVENLRPARETCEQCHWPTKFFGDRLNVITKFAEDEANTEMKTVLMMRIGGPRADRSHGIHWHVDPDIEIRYLADKTRENISVVEMKTADGAIERFSLEGADANGDPGEEEEWRVMDCVDCHNRPSHVYRTAQAELDLALHEGRISRDLPFIRREGLRVLERDYASHEEAQSEIREQVLAFYEAEYPDVLAARRTDVETAARELGEAWCTNVFPHMKVTWGTYPDHIGHEQSPGCFRCHDDLHATEDGRTISQDCDSCHALLAMEEENPEILGQLGQ